MFILSVDVNNGLEDPRIFKTHRGAMEAMLNTLKWFSDNNLACTREVVTPLLDGVTMDIDKHGVPLLDERDIEGWVDVFVTPYGGSILTKEYPHGSCCECSITNMDEIEVEE